MSILISANLERHLDNLLSQEKWTRSAALLYGMKSLRNTVALMCAFVENPQVLGDPTTLQDFVDVNNQVIPNGLHCVGLVYLNHTGSSPAENTVYLKHLRVLNSLDSRKSREANVVLVCQHQQKLEGEQFSRSKLLIDGFSSKTSDTLEKVPTSVESNVSLQAYFACFFLSANLDSALTPIHSKQGIMQALEHKLLELQIECKSDFSYSLHDNSIFLIPGLQPVVVCKDAFRGSVTAATSIKDYLKSLEKQQKTSAKSVLKLNNATFSLADITGGILPDEPIYISFFYNATDKRSHRGSSPMLTIGEGSTRLIRFQISAYMFIAKEKTLGDLVQLVELTEKTQLVAMVEYLRRFTNAPTTVEEICCPVAYHVFNGPNMITLLSGSNTSAVDAAQEAFLDELYTRFGYIDRIPIFRKQASLKNRVALTKKYILSVGESLIAKNSKFLDGSWEVVKVPGLYTYHHYKQDRFDDDGWGCAYRSLQTIFSWFKLQGYTSVPIPNHEQIQRLLVEIKDREKSLIGSKQWIGATEIARALDHLLQVSCRIVNVSSGRELGSAFTALRHHFETEGTPVMIGGGVYAYTITGVAVNRMTGEVKALVVDPHYVGDDQIDLVLKKNGVAWRTPDFWDQAAFYNLCCPMRPIST